MAAGLMMMAGCASEGAKAPQPNPATNTVSTATPAPPKAEVPVGTAPSKVPTFAERLKQAAAVTPAAFEGEGWQSMFDGQTLSGWRETKFAGRAEVECLSGLIVLNMGDPFTGLNYTNEFPKMDYEIALDAMRVMGSDFFCGLTVPVGDNCCSLIVGGWGGSLVGISSLDGMDASENETTKFINFENGKWYRIRLRITEGRIEGWIDDDKLINVDLTDRKISVRPGDIELSRPIGIASWQSTAALREIKMRRVDKPSGPPRKF